MMTATKGKLPPGDADTEPDADQELIRTDRAASYPKADGELTFDKLSSVYLSGNKTRDDAPDHLRLQRRVPRELALITLLVRRLDFASIRRLGPD